MVIEATSNNNRDKSGEALKAQRFQMLEDIAKELAGEVVFPTCFDITLRVRKLLNDPDVSLQTIATAISAEPLLSAKLLQLANSVAFNPQGQQIVDLRAAVTRLGLNALRTAAMSIVMAQMLRAKGLSHFAEITRTLWEHTIKTAAAARVIAQSAKARINADEAMLAGLVHDLGAFYMLYRATQYDELLSRPDTIKHLMAQWHESIGVSLLNALGIPEGIVEASIDHDHPRPLPAAVRNLSDVVYVANLVSNDHFEWLLQDHTQNQEMQAAVFETYGHLQPQIDELVAEIRSTLI